MSKEQEQAVADAAMIEFLAKGGAVTRCEYGKSGRTDGASYSQWSKKKPSISPLASPPDEDE